MLRLQVEYKENAERNTKHSSMKVGKPTAKFRSETIKTSTSRYQDSVHLKIAYQAYSYVDAARASRKRRQLRYVHAYAAGEQQNTISNINDYPIQWLMEFREQSVIISHTHSEWQHVRQTQHKC